MIRGTTPTISIDCGGTDLTEWDSVWLTFEYPGGRLTKTGADISVDHDGVSCTLAQADTLAFPENGRVKVQLRAERGNGASAIACDVMSFTAREVLLEEVIPLSATEGA